MEPSWTEESQRNEEIKSHIHQPYIHWSSPVSIGHIHWLRVPKKLQSHIYQSHTPVTPVVHQSYSPVTSSREDARWLEKSYIHRSSPVSTGHIQQRCSTNQLKKGRRLYRPFIYNTGAYTPVIYNTCAPTVGSNTSTASRRGTHQLCYSSTPVQVTIAPVLMQKL